MAPKEQAQLTVIGVGGAGVNAISRLLDVGQSGVRYIAADTSEQTLARVPEPARLPMAVGLRGLGTGGDDRLGIAAAVASEGRIRAALAGSDVVIVVAGMAGGTGGGAAPEIVRIARSAGAATIGFALLPFAFESGMRQTAAARAAKRLEVMCDTFISLTCDAALAGDDARVSLDLALRIADDAIRQAVQGLAELLSRRGWIHVDLATIRELVSDGGRGCVAMGLGRGTNAAQAAVQAVLESPLVEQRSWRHARSALVHVSGGPDLGVGDVAGVVTTLKAALAPDCDLVVGAGPDPALSNSVQVTALVTEISPCSLRTPIPVSLAHARRLEMAYPVPELELERDVV